MERPTLNVTGAANTKEQTRSSAASASVSCRPATNPLVRNRPQSGWLDELGRLKGGRSIGLGVAPSAPIAYSSDLSSSSIRDMLLADVVVDLFQPENYRRDSVAASLSMLPRKIALLPLQSRNGNRAYLLEKSDYRRHRMLRWYADTNLEMAGHQMPSDDSELSLFCQRVKGRAELLVHLSEQHFSTPFGHGRNVKFAVPF